MAPDSTDSTDPAGPRDTGFRPRRSVLYMPSSNERALEKAKSLPCDGLILDLEDAVAPDAKPAAREAACAAAASGEYGRRESPSGSTEWTPSGTPTTSPPPRRPVPTRSSYPRSTRAAAVTPLVEAMESRRPRPDHALGDGRDPSAMLHSRRSRPPPSGYCPGHGHQRPRQGALRRARAGPHPLLTALALCLLAARATGKAILDGVYNDVKDADGFLAECRQGREMGFDGKTLIHPGQVEGANEAFAPLRAGRRGRPRHPPGLAGRPGSGVVTYRGRMIENLHVESATRTLTIHDAINALG